MPRDCAGRRLDQALALLFPEYSRTRLAAWLKAGHVRVDGAAASARQPVLGGESIELAVPQSAAGGAPAPQALPLVPVYEDEHLIVLDKPAGLVVHPGAGNPDRTLANALVAHAPRLAALPRAGLVHRLDKETSGLIAVAGTHAAQAHLARQLAKRTMGRSYLAIVHGRLRGEGFVDRPIGRDPRSRTRMAVTSRGREARTAWRALEALAGATLVECRLDTGRTHQIRVHMQAIGHPIVGDPQYRRGAPAEPRFARQALHAAELALVHPASRRRLVLRAPLPADMQSLLVSLRKA